MEGKNISTIEIPYFEGVNCAVGGSLSKLQDLTLAENARSVTIGTVETRGGTAIVGNDINAEKNWALFYFKNQYNKGLYRISTVNKVTSIYYLNNSNVWTALTGSGTSLLELGDSTTQYDITNPAGTTFRYTYDTNGTNPNISTKIRVGSEVVIAAQNFSSGNNGTFVVTAVSTNYFEVTNAAGVVESNKTIGTGYIRLSSCKFSVALAEGRCFIVNGHNDNFYISNDGTTVITSATSSGYLYGTPKAHKINYYKGRLYLADYTYNNVRYKNGVFYSSLLLGIVALVDGDYSASGGAITINVTDTKYIKSSDTLLVYRGGSAIATLTVTAKTEYSITASSLGSDLLSADELWINGTYSGEKIFRWADTPATGEQVKEYDTFRLAGGQNDEITMLTNVGDVMVVANANNMAVWNDSSLQNIDLGIGCVSSLGYGKHLGLLYFVHYSGIYATSGGVPQIKTAAVERYITGATKSGLEGAVFGKKGYSVFFNIGNVTLYNPDGSTEKVLNNAVLENNLKQSNWFVHSDVPMTGMETLVDSSSTDRLCFLSEESGYPVLEYLVGASDYATSSTTRDIQFRIDTKDILLSTNFWKLGNPIEIIVEQERGSGTKCFVSLDGGKFYELRGEAGKGVYIFRVGDENDNDGIVGLARCRKIKISLRNNIGKPCKISRIALRFVQTLEEEINLEENYGK